MNTHHKIWRIAAPMIVANISVPLLGLADTAILGHLASAQYLAAVAVGSSLLMMLYWSLGFLRMGTTGASAQALGSNSHLAQSEVLIQSSALALVLGLLVLLLSPLILPAALALMNTPGQSLELALTYTEIRLFSAPAVLLTYVASGWLIGQQRTRWVLIIAVSTNALNIALDYTLILGFGMNSRGAAIASLVSEYVGAGIALIAVAPALTSRSRRELRIMLSQLHSYTRILSANGALFVRTTLLLFAFAFFTAQGAKFGATVLAANTILLNLMLFTAHGLDAFAHAAEALVGEAVGQRDWTRFKAVCLASAQWSTLTGLLLCGTLLLGEGPILALMTNIPDVANAANTYYGWLLVMPLVSVACYLLDGIFIGALQTRAMQYSMVFSVALVYLPIWSLTHNQGNHGLWLAFALFNVSRGVSLGLVFIRLTRNRQWWP
ncbi:MAG: MATE family multidrug resistance protein [Paracoccaceae bacterium]|jgi:MATE family multidrug resistance protein